MQPGIRKHHIPDTVCVCFCVCVYVYIYIYIPNVLFSCILFYIPSILAKAMIFDWLDGVGVRMVKLKGSRQFYKQIFIFLSNIYLICTDETLSSYSRQGGRNTRKMRREELKQLSETWVGSLLCHLEVMWQVTYLFPAQVFVLVVIFVWCCFGVFFDSVIGVFSPVRGGLTYLMGGCFEE